MSRNAMGSLATGEGRLGFTSHTDQIYGEAGHL